MFVKFKQSLASLPWFLRPKFYWHLFLVVFMPRPGKKKILGIWDYKALPWSIGDPLLFVEKLSLLKFEKNAEDIDICIVYDKQDPTGNRKSTTISSVNAQEYTIDYFPLFKTCPYLGTIYHFNSRSEFYEFLRNSIDSGRYEVFPPLKEQLSEMYNFRNSGASDVMEMQEFYEKHGFLPHLRIGHREMAWARDFYSQQVPVGCFPVVVSMRRPKSLVFEERNAVPEIWLSFFDRCAKEFPEVMFFIIGTRDEVFPELRTRSNIKIAKDFGTSIMEDLALLRSSVMYIGTCAGVNLVAWCSELPYLIVQHTDLEYYNLKDPHRMRFANEKQRIFGTSTPVTSDLLFNEFKNIYGSIDKFLWAEMSGQKAGLIK